jgi:hypothetical protein
MNKNEIRILKDLFESQDGYQAFSFYSRYGIEPDEMFKYITKFQNKGYATYTDSKLRLTPDGRRFTLEKLFYSPIKGDKFSEIPNEFLAPKIKINSPYLPDVHQVSSEITGHTHGEAE